MLWKLSAALVFALAWLPAPSVRAEETDEPATEEASEPEASAATEEPAESEETEGAGDDSDADAAGYDRDGWYLGLGGGYAMELFDTGSWGDSGFAQIRAGYHFLRFAALEPQIEYTPKFKGKSSFAGVDTATWAVWLNAKGYPTAPWTSRFQPYALVGAAWMWARATGSAINGSVEEGGFAARFGGGIDLYVTDHIVVTAESAWVLPTGDLDGLNQVQIGGALQYRF
jgi:opacity protein-like surface antigen